MCSAGIQMTVAERVRRCRVIEKMEQNVEYAEKLGLSKSSSFRRETTKYYNWKIKSEVEK